MSAKTVELSLSDKTFCDPMEYYVRKFLFLTIVIHFEGGDSGKTMEKVLEPCDVYESGAVVEAPRHES